MIHDVRGSVWPRSVETDKFRSLTKMDVSEELKGHPMNFEALQEGIPFFRSSNNVLLNTETADDTTLEFVVPIARHDAWRCLSGDAWRAS